MPISDNVGDNEKSKFTEDADGETAVRVVMEAGIEVGPLVKTTERPLTNFPTPTVETGITAAAGFIITAITDQKWLLVQLHISGIWYWSTDTSTVPTRITGNEFGSISQLELENMNTDIIIAPESITGDVTISKGSL